MMQHAVTLRRLATEAAVSDIREGCRDILEVFFSLNSLMFPDFYYNVPYPSSRHLSCLDHEFALSKRARPGPAKDRVSRFSSRRGMPATLLLLVDAMLSS